MEGDDPNTTPPDPAPQDPGGQAQPPQEPTGPFTEKLAHSPISARVPEKVARGVLSTGVVVLHSQNEFVLDFLQGLSRPPHVASRVVLPPIVMGQLIGTLQANLERYTQTFGPPPPLPKPTGQRPSIQEIYDNYKLGDDLLSGSYANAVMIGHSPSEFIFDFITSFFPTAAVSSRVFLAAPQVPRMLEALISSYRNSPHGRQPM